MTSVMIRLHNIEQIKLLVKIAADSPYDIDIASGRYVIDAKSILGIFSLDLSKPMELIIHEENCEDILAQIEAFIIK